MQEQPVPGATFPEFGNPTNGHSKSSNRISFRLFSNQHKAIFLTAILAVTLLASGSAQAIDSKDNHAGERRQIPSTELQTTAIPPLTAALHFLHPLGVEQEHAPNLDRTLTNFLEVRPCDESVTGCPALASLTARTNGASRSGEDSFLRLKDDSYRVGWRPDRSLRNSEVRIQVLAAGLLIGSLDDVLVRGGGDLNIKFRVDNHPRIRARVLHASGVSAAGIALALRNEFSLGGADVTRLLFAEQFSAIEIAGALQSVFNPTPQLAAQWMRDAGIATVDLARALRVVFGLSDASITQILHDIGVSAVEMYAALKAITPGLIVEDGENDLQDAGYSEDDVFAAIQQDLVARYTAWAKAYGPHLFLHSQEQFKLAAIDWYMSNSYLSWTLPEGCPPPDLVNGGPCNTKVAAMSPENLAEFLRVNFLDNEHFLFDLHSVNTKDENAVRRFIEGLDIRVVPGSDAIRAGIPDQNQATVYVHAIRNKTPGDPAFGTTDLEFAFLYAYNGPGTLQFDTFVFDRVRTTKQRLDPLATHIPDWETATIRIKNDSGEILEVTGSAHGKVSNLGPGFEDGAHPVLLAAKDGHGIFSGGGENLITKGNFAKDLKPLGKLGVEISVVNATELGELFDVSNHFQIMSIYDTCVNSRKQATPGLCEAFNPVEGSTRPPNHNFVVPIDICRYSNGKLAIRPLNLDADDPLPPVAPSVPADIARAACPRLVTVNGDGSRAPNKDWWLFQRFGPEKQSVLSQTAWERLINDSVLPDLLPVMTAACAAVTGGIGTPECLAATVVAFEAIMPAIKDQVIDSVLPTPHAPTSPYWKPCFLTHDQSC